MKKKLPQHSYLYHFEHELKRILLTFSLSILFVGIASANGGIGYKGIYINNNGTKTWYKAHNVAWGYSGCTDFSFNSASDFSGQNLGTISTSTTFQIAGYAVVGWTDNTDWVAGKLLYKVWKQGDTEPGIWSEIYVGNYGNGSGASQVVCSSGTDRVVGYNNGITNINPGYPGTFNIKIQALGRMQWSGGFFNTNDGSELTATFTITSSATDYFRTLSSGNWSSESSWESSANNSNWGTSTLIPGTNAVTVSILNGHNITLDANATVPNLTINSGATFTASDATARTLTISKSTSGTATTLTNNGTWNNGTGGSTVVFTGNPNSGDAIHAITGTISFQNLTVTKTGGTANIGASFGANSSLTGTLEIGTGGFIATAPPVSFYNSNAILKFNQGTGVTYDVNASDYTWSNTVVPNNITIGSGIVNINSNRVASGDLIISGNAVLNISAGKQLSINSSLLNNGTLNIKSTLIGGTATIITPATVSGSGSYNIEQYLSGGRNWYISSPLSSVSANIITNTAGNSVYERNESLATFPVATSFVAGKGYVATIGAANSGVYTFTGGSINTGEVIIPITRTNAVTKAGFNLVGNPFPAHLKWLESTATAAGVLPTIWYRTYNTGYAFETYNAPSGLSVPNNDNGYIPPMQAFWVRKSNDGTSNLTLNASNAEHRTSNPLKSKKTTENKIVRLQLTTNNNGLTDETLIYFNPSNTTGFDNYDSPKWVQAIDTVAEIFTVTGNEQLVINGQPQIIEETEYPLGFRTGTSGSYTLKSTELTNIADNYKVILLDRLNTVNETELTENSIYTFNSDAVNSTDRFSLIFRLKGATTGFNNTSNTQNKIIVIRNSDNSVTVNCFGAKNDSKLSVFNLSGQKIFDAKVEGSTTIKNTLINQGIYIFRLTTEGKIINQKIML